VSSGTSQGSVEHAMQAVMMGAGNADPTLLIQQWQILMPAKCCIEKKVIPF